MEQDKSAVSQSKTNITYVESKKMIQMKLLTKQCYEYSGGVFMYEASPPHPTTVLGRDGSFNGLCVQMSTWRPREGWQLL